MVGLDSDFREKSYKIKGGCSMNKKIFKTCVTYLLAVAMLATASGTIAATEEESEQPSQIASINFEDGTDSKFGLSEIVGVYTKEATDEQHGNSLHTENKGKSSTKAYIDFADPIRNGIWYISYEVLNTTKTNYNYTAFNTVPRATAVGADDYMKTFTFQKAGKFGHFYGLDVAWSIDQNTITEYDVNRWYKIDQWIDFDRRTIDFYVDNEFFATQSLPDHFNEMHSFYFIQDSQAEGGSYWDNIKILRVDSDTAYSMKKEGINFPDRFASYLNIKFDTDAGGHIFGDGENIDFNINATNIGEKDKTFTANFVVSDEMNNTVWSEQKDISVKDGESADNNLKINIGKKYGFFNLKAEFKDLETGNISKGETRFSVINYPYEENPNWGVCVHYQRVIDIDLAAEVFKNAGFSAVRANIGDWRDVEQVKGVYKFDDQRINGLKTVSDYGMGSLSLAYGRNELYSPEHPPHSDDALTHFANYAYEFTKKVTDITGEDGVYIEAWNEYNHTATFNPDKRPPEDYVKMLKYIYPKIKAANPKAQVVGFNPSGTAAEWCEKVFKAGGGEYSDIISIHPYSTLSPEEGGWVAKVKQVKELMAEYGCEDKPLWASEAGWSSASVGEDLQAAFAVRMMVLNTANDLIDKIFWYTAQNHTVSTPHEQNFGLLRYWANEDVPYEAKPVLLAISNYNALMNGAEFVESWESGGDVNTFRYKTADGKDALVIYSLSGSKNYAIETDADSCEFYDMYGNKSDLYAENGKFNLMVNDNPIFLMGDFGNVEVGKTPVVIPETLSISGIKNDLSSMKISDNAESELRYEFEMSDGVQLAEENVNGIEGKMLFRLGNGENDRIKIRAYNDKGLCYVGDIPIIYEEGVDVTLSVVPYRNSSSNRWQGVLKVENNSYDMPISGTLKITEPKDIMEKMGTIQITEVPGGSTKNFKFHLPELMEESIELKGVCELSNGKTYELGGEYKLATLDYAMTRPTIDGVISDGEWNVGRIAKINDPLKVTMDGYGGLDDLSGESYLKWDDDNFYMCVKVKDNVQCHEYDLGRIWAGDSVQFAMAYEKLTSASRTEIGFGLDGNNQPQIDRTYFMGTDPALNFTNYELAINRNEEEKTTVYELAMPWSNMLPYGVKPGISRPMYLAMLINDNDEGTRRGWIEYGGGIAVQKDPAQFVELHFLKRQRQQ